MLPYFGWKRNWGSGHNSPKPMLVPQEHETRKVLISDGPVPTGRCPQDPEQTHCVLFHIFVQNLREDIGVLLITVIVGTRSGPVSSLSE